MNICINKIKSAKKKKFFFLHFTNLYYGNVNTEQKKKKRGKMTSRMIRRVTALQRSFRIQSSREFVPQSMIIIVVPTKPGPCNTYIRCRQQGGIIFRAHSIFVEVGSRYIRPIFIAGTRASRYLREESKVNWNPTLDSCESFTFVSFTGTNDMYRRYNMCTQ